MTSIHVFPLGAETEESCELQRSPGHRLLSISSYAIEVAQLLRKNIKSALSRRRLDAPRRPRIDQEELAAASGLAPSGQDASQDAILRIATGRIEMGLCHNWDFLNEHVLMSMSIHQPAFHPSWLRIIGVSGNFDSYA